MCTLFRRAFFVRPATFYWVATLLVTLIGSRAANAQNLPTGFKIAKAQNNYTAPMGIVFSADGKRQFVWEKSGLVWVSNWDGVQYVKQNTPVLDISEEVGNYHDFGLASLCLDPNFSQNGRVYLYYQVDRHHLMKFGTAEYSATTNEYSNASISRVTRYQFATDNGNLVTVANSRKVLVGETKSTGVPLIHESHAGGALLFGSDGSLLLSTGDNGSWDGVDKGSAKDTYHQQAISDGIMRANENVGSFRSQLLNSHCGKLLRMDPNTGDGLSSNPYYDSANPRSAQSRVWALGLRHPYRMSLLPNTGSANMGDGNPGTVLIGDVGWNAWEETTVIRQGGVNAGWPIFEGQEVQPDYSAAANTLENRDEPNPANTCNKPYLTFADLVKQPTNPVQTVNNPCSGQPLPGLQRRYIHARPALDWKHGANVARTPSFNGSFPTATSVGDAGGASGSPFGGNCAIGGAVYTGTTFPSEWRNTYFFGDFGANWIKAATVDASGNVTQVREFLPGGSANGIVDIEYNPLDGALYVVSIYSNEVMKISYGGNQPPIAQLSASTLNGNSPLTVSFKGDGSSDPNGDALTYAWNFGDGTTSTQPNPTNVFTGTGVQGITVTLTVSDGKGLSDTKSVLVSLNNTAPTAKITNPGANTLYPLDRESQYTLSASVTDEETSSLTYAWQVTLRHNNHEHREPINTSLSPTITVSPVGCDGETYYYFIRLTVTDKGGLTATDSVKIYPDCNSGKLAIADLKATAQGSSVQLAWTAPAVTYDNVLVVAKAGSGFSDRPSSQVYPADANFMGTGADFFGGKVMYQGVASNLTVTNLTAGQTYYFRVYTRRGGAWTGGVETSAAMAPFPVKAGSCYRLVARTSGKVLTSDGTDNGSAVTQRTDANLASQQWKFAATSDGYYQIISQKTGKVFDQVGNQQTDRGPLGIWDYVGGNNQQWKPMLNADGYTQFLARHSGKAIDLLDFSTNEGAVIGQYTANTSNAQQWRVEERSCIVPAPPVPAFTVKANSCYRLVARSSGKVLGSEGGANGAEIRQRTDANLAAQQWKFSPTSDGYYQIVSQQTSKVIDVTGVSMDDRAPLILWEYVGGGNQQWKPVQNADGYTQFIARHSGKAIDLLDFNPSEGAVIAQYPINTGTAQQWRVEERTCVLSPTACYKISSRNGGKVIGVQNASKNDGTQIRQQTYAGKASQQWKLQVNADGYYRVTNGNSGKVIDVSGGSTNDLANLIQWTSTGSPNQQWKVALDGQGYYTFTARHSGKMMDQRESNVADNAEIIQWPATGAQNQQWLIDAVGCSIPGSRIGAADFVTALPAYSDNQYVLYPNPAQLQVNVDLQAAQGQPASVTLTDLRGKALYRRLVNTETEPYHTISTSEYAAGIYMIVIDVADQPKATLRLVIER